MHGEIGRTFVTDLKSVAEALRYCAPSKKLLNYFLAGKTTVCLATCVGRYVNSKVVAYSLQCIVRLSIELNVAKNICIQWTPFF